jgi:tetratricopeptide (TPR) repeat protein
VHHEANFDAERKQANDLFLAGKILESLPLYEDLCRQDPSIAVFAERHGTGLLQKAGTLGDTPEAKALSEQATAELRRAQSLGDNSPYLQTVLALPAKTPIGAIISGVPLTPGWIHKGTPEAQAKFKEAEIAFSKQDYKTAVGLYEDAAALDPAWYDASLFAGDMYFRMNDWGNAAIWFQKAIDIDPERDTAYRYWGDALYRSGNAAEARLKYEQAVVAQPYDKAPWLALQQWATVTRTPMRVPQIRLPDFTTTPDGKLKIDAALTVETGDGHASWLVYQEARVAHGARVLGQWIVPGATDVNGHIHPTGYRHTLAEEAECINLMLADVQKKLDAGTVMPEKLEPSLKNLIALKKDGMIECWILLNAADAGIRYDYPDYRTQHRELLAAYVDHYILAPTSTATR